MMESRIIGASLLGSTLRISTSKECLITPAVDELLRSVNKSGR
jgi:hypothetical protein